MNWIYGKNSQLIDAGRQAGQIVAQRVTNGSKLGRSESGEGNEEYWV